MEEAVAVVSEYVSFCGKNWTFFWFPPNNIPTERMKKYFAVMKVIYKCNTVNSGLRKKTQSCSLSRGLSWKLGICLNRKSFDLEGLQRTITRNFRNEE